MLVIGGLFILVTIFGGSGDEVLTEETETTQVETGEVASATLPTDIPTNIPIYPGSVLQSSQRNDTDSEKNITLSLATGDSVADVNTWYRGALRENGWAVTGDQNVGGYVLLKGENENLTVFMQAANNSDLGKVIITERIRMK